MMTQENIEALELWSTQGLRPGGFLTRVLCNDLFGAFAVADLDNRADLFDIVQWCYTNLPAGSHGSEEKLTAWEEKKQKELEPIGDPLKPKIYVFINAGEGTDWVRTVALAESGHQLAGHVSSTDMWAWHDIGLSSESKHDLYQAHYPGGYQLVRVDEPRDHPGVKEAIRLNQLLPKE